VAALLSLLVNKHGQKGEHHLTSVELIQGSKRREKARGKNEEEVAAKTRDIQVTILQWQ